jgi:hypothetical protein
MSQAHGDLPWRADLTTGERQERRPRKEAKTLRQNLHSQGCSNKCGTISGLIFQPRCIDQMFDEFRSVSRALLTPLPPCLSTWHPPSRTLRTPKDGGANRVLTLLRTPPASPDTARTGERMPTPMRTEASGTKAANRPPRPATASETVFRMEWR